MEILRWEPSVVVVGLTLADARILSQGIEVETFLEPGCNDGRYEHAAALRSAFQGIVEALRLQDRVIDNIMADCAARAQATQGGTECCHVMRS